MNFEKIIFCPLQYTGSKILGLSEPVGWVHSLAARPFLSGYIGFMHGYAAFSFHKVLLPPIGDSLPFHRYIQLRAAHTLYPTFLPEHLCSFIALQFYFVIFPCLYTTNLFTTAPDNPGV